MIRQLQNTLLKSLTNILLTNIQNVNEIAPIMHIAFDLHSRGKTHLAAG